MKLNYLSLWHKSAGGSAKHIFFHHWYLFKCYTYFHTPSVHTCVRTNLFVVMAVCTPVLLLRRSPLVVLSRRLCSDLSHWTGLWADGHHTHVVGFCVGTECEGGEKVTVTVIEEDLRIYKVQMTLLLNVHDLAAFLFVFFLNINHFSVEQTESCRSSKSVTKQRNPKNGHTFVCFALRFFLQGA